MSITKENLQRKDFLALDIAPSLKEHLSLMSAKCLKCKLCQKECAFLRKYGEPKDIADSYDPSDKACQDMPFECSLCYLCGAVCPVKINPALMFLEMRREEVRHGRGNYPEHQVMLGFERLGTSKKYTFSSIPRGCKTIFFPGCTFSGTRPEKVKRLYEYIREIVPSAGIVLDCCTKPSHDLGRDEYFHTMFDDLKDFLLNNGIAKVIVACPSCYEVFKKYGGGLALTTVYEFMARHGLPKTGKATGSISVHDSCVLRFEESMHATIRDLITRKGLTIEEMPHARKTTLCCGKGGSVAFLAQDFTRNWGCLRSKEAAGKRLISYCAGCANSLNSHTPTIHVIDLIFEPLEAMSGKVKVSKSPLTYLNRLKLKQYFKKTANRELTCERNFKVAKESG